MSEDTTDVDTDDGDEDQPKPDKTSPANTGKDSGNDATARRLAELEKELSDWKSHSRKHEDEKKALAAQLKGSKPDKDRLAELEAAVSAAEQDRLSERRFNALTQVQLRLAEAGIKSDDVAGILDGYDASALLKDGKPNSEAIDRLANSLIKVASRATPDPDQGRRGGDGPVDMNALIRRAARIST